MRIRLIAALAGIALLCAGCGQRQPSGRSQGDYGAATPGGLRPHPQAVEPVAGDAAPATQGSSGPAIVSVDNSNATGPLPQPVSDAEIRRELAHSGIGRAVGRAKLTPNGLAVPPANAPAVVQQIIEAGNQIAHLPYRFGGGHGTFFDNAYDCSGSISFVFGAAGLLNTTVTSGQLMGWGDPGNGRWITVFANEGHTFMYVAGLRFDTVALAQTGTRWSDRPANEPDLASFVVRHPPGM